jgi:hypothetical protein
MDEDRAAGWELRRAPLLRLALARVGEREWRFLFSAHHLLMDGWSMALVLADFGELYEGERAGRAAVLPRRPAFRDYVAWLGKRDEGGAAEAFWRARLAGVDEPTPLPLDRAPARAGTPAEEHGQETVPLAAEMARALAEAARRHRVTPSTLAQAAWAAVLARYAGRRDVVFGATVSGRPPEVPGVEEMVGLFINTVPVRVRVPPPARRRSGCARCRRSRPRRATTSCRRWPRCAAGAGCRATRRSSRRCSCSRTTP